MSDLRPEEAATQETQTPTAQQTPLPEYKYRISKLYQDWNEVTAELGSRADDLNEQNRVLTLVDCDVDYCENPDCEYCAGELVEIDDEVDDDDRPYHPAI